MSTPPVVVTKAAESDHPALESVWNEVYGDIIGPVSSFMDDRHDLYIGRVDGEAAFACKVSEYSTHVRGGRLKTAAVGAVATAGRFRGTGAGTDAMRQVHRMAQSDGFCLAALYGYRDTFYRRVGYATCGWRWLIKADVERMPQLDLELPVRTIEADETGLIDPCYNAFSSTFSGSTLRPGHLWKRRLGKTGPTIYAFGDPVEAYFWCKPHGFFVPLEIGEFAWSSDRGYRSALAHMRMMAINKSSVEWCEPPNGPFFALYHDERVTYTRHRGSMFTVLDPARAFQVFGIGADAEDGGVRLRAQGLSGASISVQAATQLLLGDPSPDVLAAQAQIGSQDLAVLTHLLPAQPVCCMDFF